jgi:hypothetical protein
MGVEDFQRRYAEVEEMTLEGIIQSGRYRRSNKEGVSHVEGGVGNIGMQLPSLFHRRSGEWLIIVHDNSQLTVVSC